MLYDAGMRFEGEGGTSGTLSEPFRRGDVICGKSGARKDPEALVTWSDGRREVSNV